MKLKIAIMAAAAMLTVSCGDAGGGIAAAQIDASLESQAWPAFYQRAGELFEQGRRDEAVTLFYIGQLRGRIVAQCKDVPPDQDPALLASFNATLGQTINEYAGGSPRGWADAIDRALEWDAAHPDPNASSARCRSERMDQREGLGQLRTMILSSADAIRRQRTENGLPNR
jgi:hypothetical protein